MDPRPQMEMTMALKTQMIKTRMDPKPPRETRVGLQAKRGITTDLQTRKEIKREHPRLPKVREI